MSDSEFADLYNEARREFARRTKYPRKLQLLGQTEDGVAAYDWPTDLLLPLSVRVGGEPAPATTKETVEQYVSGELALQTNRVWYDQPDDTGLRKLTIYPTPAEAMDIYVEHVFRPVPLSADEPDGEPQEIPEEFHSHPSYYVAALYYRSAEDNPELAQVNEQAFDLKVADLVRYDNQRRAGNGIFRIGISGQTA